MAKCKECLHFDVCKSFGKTVDFDVDDGVCLYYEKRLVRCKNCRYYDRRKEKRHMTAQEIIAYADMVYPNVNTQEEKLHWLWQLDVMLKKQTAHLGLFSNEIPMYDAQSELLIERLYSHIYVLYLSTNYNFYNGDLERYNESAALFNDAYGRYLDCLAEREGVKT